MTSHKDFKRLVRARSRRTGESYSSALRQLRNARPDGSAATASASTTHERPLMDIVRAIPDVRSTSIDKTVEFYCELLGFDTRTDDGQVVSFVSPSDPRVEVTLNRDGFALPPGFTVEVAAEDDVARLFEAAPSAEVRVIEPLRDAQFSVLDPSGLRVTIAAADGDRRAPGGDATRRITRVIPETVLPAPAATRFYGEYLGFETRGTWPDVVLFGSAAGAEVIATTTVVSPSAFDLDVGTTGRVDAIHGAAVGRAVVMGPPQDFPEQGVRCFLLIDPNGIAINVLAPLH